VNKPIKSVGDLKFQLGIESGQHHSDIFHELKIGISHGKLFAKDPLLEFLFEAVLLKIETDNIPEKI